MENLKKNHNFQQKYIGSKKIIIHSDIN